MNVALRSCTFVEVPPTGVFPRRDPRPTESKAEEQLFGALTKKLPKGWTAWHSLRLRVDGSVEGEGDFVIAIPNRGVLVLEVKGGAIHVADGQWFQNGSRLSKPPRDQGLRFARMLRERLEADGVHAPYTSVAVAFPQTSFDDGPPHADLRGIVIGAEDVPHLDDALPAIVERLFVRNGEAIVSRGTDWIDRLHNYWGETWTPKLTLRDERRRREAEMVPWDEFQLRILSGIEHNRQFLVNGGPGTGKTMIARELANRLAQRGLKVLYLCWTRALAQGQRAEGLANAWAIREYAAFLLEQANIHLQNGEPSARWTVETWEDAVLHAAYECAPALAWDAVIVDEGQDFTANDWELVKSLAGDRILWAFADEGQSYWPERKPPPGLFTHSFALPKRYRCPEALACFADLYRASRPHFGAEPPVGAFSELQIVRAPSASSLGEKVAREIEKARHAGLASDDIAVLSLAGVTKTVLANASAIGRTAVVRADDAKADEAVVADTFLRFKGLERPLVIVSELSLGPKQYDTRMHIALTRATMRCVVVATGEEIDADPRLAARQ